MREEIGYYVWILISALATSYVTAQVSCYRINKRNQIILWTAMSLTGVFANVCLFHGWMIMDQIMVGQIIKICYLVIIFFVIGMFVRGGIIRMTLSVLLADVIVAVTAMITNVIVYFLERAGEAYTVFYSYSSGSLEAVLLLIIDFVVCVVPTRYYRKLREIPFEKHVIAKILAVGYLIIGFVFLSGDTFELSATKNQIVFLMAFLSILLLVLLFVILREENLLYRQTNRQLFLQEQMQREYVHLLEEQTALTRKIRHDIRKHLDMVSFLQDNDTGIRDSEPLKAYENNLLELCRELTTGDYCSSSEVNAVFYQLEKYCSRNGLDFQARIRNISFDTIVSRGDTPIFLNAVNWMMEQCERLKEQGVPGDSTGVELSGTVLMGVNTLNLILWWKGRREELTAAEPGARKNPQDRHVQSIRQCLKTYGGMADMFTGDRECRLTICWKC